MAERVAGTVGYRSECLHLDLRKAVEKDAETAIRVDFTTTIAAAGKQQLGQGRMRFMHGARNDTPWQRDMIPSRETTRAMRRPYP